MVWSPPVDREKVSSTSLNINYCLHSYLYGSYCTIDSNKLTKKAITVASSDYSKRGLFLDVDEC